MTASIVVEKITTAVRATVDAYSAQEQAEIRLQTTLKATQNAVGMSASELLDLADSLQKVTAYSDQEIIAVEGILAATRKVGRDVMPEATNAVLNMAAAIGEEATLAAERLAQALADPAGEIESLKEAGIQLTEAQSENVKGVQEQNGIYSAQKIILKEIAGYGYSHC
ncbi:MAG: phage tail length tape measure family protein [Spirochaetes bacterium]|uniref:Phage tail length tape measure family protein n=1 Tax=Candidatus Ornithospirochaeta stercoripullorum TaxID=2840899 RepID=A0A9D9DZ42_9SPIO|nr:phage tail length tape measure family protein [Candidatus Ornithospirochaeta stercoripullorum]